MTEFQNSKQLAFDLILDYNLVLNAINLRLGVYLCGSGFPAAIKRFWIQSGFFSWLESHSHEKLMLC